MVTNDQEQGSFSKSSSNSSNSFGNSSSVLTPAICRSALYDLQLFQTSRNSNSLGQSILAPEPKLLWHSVPELQGSTFHIFRFSSPFRHAFQVRFGMFQHSDETHAVACFDITYEYVPEFLPLMHQNELSKLSKLSIGNLMESTSFPSSLAYSS